MNSDTVRSRADDGALADDVLLAGGDDLRDDADDFEDALLAEMMRRGAIEMW